MRVKPVHPTGWKRPAGLDFWTLLKRWLIAPACHNMCAVWLVGWFVQVEERQWRWKGSKAAARRRSKGRPKPEPAVQETSDFEVSEDGFSESDKKDEEEVTFDFITAADLSEETSEGKRGNVGSVCVSDERDSGEREPARNIERVSRDPIRPAESDREPSNDKVPRDSAAHRLSADCQSSLASQQVPSGAEQTADRESNSEGRSRSHIRPEEASQFVEEDMRINMIQPVYSQAHQVRRTLHFCHKPQPHNISNLDVI